MCLEHDSSGLSEQSLTYRHKTHPVRSVRTGKNTPTTSFVFRVFKGQSHVTVLNSFKSYYIEGHSGQKCNINATCILLDRIRVPLVRTFIPLHRSFLPLDRTSIPLDRTFLSFDRTLIALDWTFLPFDRTFIPLDRAFLPFDRMSPHEHEIEF